MAHRAFRKIAGMAVKERKILQQQKFNHLLIIDFEATCEPHRLLVPQEVIEFPCLAVSTADWTLKNTFHEYVRPRVHPELSEFCTSLTGITQGMVNNSDYFPDVFLRLQQWMAENDYLKENDSLIVTCGDWDLRVLLPQQCRLDDIEIPPKFQEWTDLKRIYLDCIGRFPRSLKDMLVELRLPLRGRLHSGIDDAKNIIQVIEKLQKNSNPIFDVTSKL